MKNEGLPKYYTVLFNAVEDALDAIEQQNYGLARTALVKGQLEAEDLYISAPEPATDKDVEFEVEWRKLGKKTAPSL